MADGIIANSVDVAMTDGGIEARDGFSVGHEIAFTVLHAGAVSWAWSVVHEYPSSRAAIRKSPAQDVAWVTPDVAEAMTVSCLVTDGDGTQHQFSLLCTIDSETPSTPVYGKRLVRMHPDHVQKPAAGAGPILFQNSVTDEPSEMRSDGTVHLLGEGAVNAAAKNFGTLAELKAAVWSGFVDKAPVTVAVPPMSGVASLGTGAGIAGDDVLVTRTTNNPVEGTVDNPTGLGVIYWTSGTKVANLAALALISVPDAVSAPSNTHMVVQGHTTPGDGGGGSFDWVATSTDAHDGGVTINPTGRTVAGRWKRQYSGPVKSSWFGITNSGDQYTELAAWLGFGGAGTQYQLDTDCSCSVHTGATPHSLTLPSGATLWLGKHTITALEIAQSGGSPVVAHQDCSLFVLNGVDNVDIVGGSLTSTLPDAVPGVTHEGGPAYGIKVTNSTRVRLTDLDISAMWWDGVISWGTTLNELTLNNVRSHHNRRSGWSHLGGGNIKLIGGEYDHNGASIVPQEPGAGIDVELTGGATGGQMNGLTLTDVKIHDNNIGGYIQQGDAGGRPQNVTLQRVDFTDNATVGLSALGCDGFIADCCTGSGQNGVIVGGAGQYVIGVSNSTGVLLSRGVYSDNSRSIMVAYSTNVGIVDNSITGDAATRMGDYYDGITIIHTNTDTTKKGCHHVRVHGNNVSQQGGRGLYATRVSNLDLANNDIRDNGRHGAEFSACTGRMRGGQVSGSSRETNGRYADILIGSESNGFTVQDVECKWHAKWSSGTAQGGTTDYVTLGTNESDQMLPDYYQGAPLTLTGGTGSGQWRTINLYNPSTRRADVDGLVTGPSTDTTYEIRYPNKACASVLVEPGSTDVKVLDIDHNQGANVLHNGDAPRTLRELPAAMNETNLVQDPTDITTANWDRSNNLGTCTATRLVEETSATVRTHHLEQTIVGLSPGSPCRVTLLLEAGSANRGAYIQFHASESVYIDLTTGLASDATGLSDLVSYLRTDGKVSVSFVCTTTATALSVYPTKITAGVPGLAYAGTGAYIVQHSAEVTQP